MKMLSEEQVKPAYTCSVCSATWTPKKKTGLPQRCPRCKSKMWNSSCHHTCFKCGYSWVSPNAAPNRCPKCQSRKWNGERTSSSPQSSVQNETRLLVLIHYGTGQGCVDISISLGITFGTVIDIIRKEYPDSDIRL